MPVQHKILLKSTKGYVFKALDEMLYFKACDKYAELYLQNGSIEMVFHSLAEIENKLCCGERFGPYFFYRIHRQFIAAIHYADAWPENKRILLEGDLPLPVSRSRIEGLKNGLTAVQGQNGALGT